MCGIVGIRAETLQQTGGDFAQAMRALAWRGRDGSGTALVGGWQLGVTRLAISDPHAGQPIVCPSTGRTIVFNGAVTSAAQEWVRYGAGRTTRNDAELPLLRLRVGGASALAPRCGHHAFAVVEPDGAAWLARDGFGEKPLYVVRDGVRVVAFASTAAALRALGFGIELGTATVAQFFRQGWHGTPSVVGDLTLDDDRHGVWSARDGEDLPQEREPWSDRPLRLRVQAAVERCATAEVGVGLALSGGIDSACIGACLATAKRRDLLAFQFCARGAPQEERWRAETVARAHGLRLVKVDGGPELLADLAPLTRAAGLPLGDPSVLAAHAVARAAARAGVKVLLSGEGGDELFFGYRRHRAAAWLPRRPHPWWPRPPALSQRAPARWLRAMRSADYGDLLAVTPPGVAHRALVPDLWPRPAAAAAEDPLAHAIDVDRRGYLRRDLLPKLDLATLYAGVEGRCPFLDPEVASAPETEVALARHGLGKRALRAAFAADLPRAVLRMRKTGFGVPLDRWVREDAFLADLLRDRRTLERAHVVKAGLSDLLDRHRAGRCALGHALYLFAAYETYLRMREEPSCAG